MKKEWWKNAIFSYVKLIFLVEIWNSSNSIHSFQNSTLFLLTTQSLVFMQRIQLSCYWYCLHFHFTLVNLIFDVAISTTSIEHKSNATGIHTSNGQVKIIAWSRHRLGLTFYFLWKYQYWINAIAIWIIPFNRQSVRTCSADLIERLKYSLQCQMNRIIRIKHLFVVPC